jgi:DNA-3-methyladenine glycosylase
LRTIAAVSRALPPALFTRPTLEVAQALIGATLTTEGWTVRIVETEAYCGDPASHWVTRPKTGRMLGETHGCIYVYSIYGMHRCLNFTTDASGPGAVLLRAVEPLRGLDEMRRRRPVRRDVDLTNGPAKLVVALGIDPALHGRPVHAAFELTPPDAAPEIHTGPRVGISKARDLPWRFWLAGNPYVSRSR